MVKGELGVNITLGASNVSFGLPSRETINGTFIAMAINDGLTCPIVDAAHVRPYILAADLALTAGANAPHLNLIFFDGFNRQ